MVHLSKSAGFCHELFDNMFRTVYLTHISPIQGKHYSFQAVFGLRLCNTAIFSLYFNCAFHCLLLYSDDIMYSTNNNDEVFQVFYHMDLYTVQHGFYQICLDFYVCIRLCEINYSTAVHQGRPLLMGWIY